MPGDGQTISVNAPALPFQPPVLNALIGLNAKGLGAQGNGASDAATQALNRNALRQGAAAIAAGNASVLYLPAGTYDLGTDTAALVQLIQNNIALLGDGYDVTVIKYNSNGQGGTVGPGILFQLGDALAHTYSGFYCRGITFIDTFTTRVAHAGHEPAALDIAGYSNVFIEQCRFNNIKGNSAINYLGNVAAGVVTTKIFKVMDCIFDGDSASGWIEGDAVNWGAIDGCYMIRNKITGCARHGFEGGGFGFHVFCDDNFIDFGLGFGGPADSGLSNHGFGVQTVGEAMYRGNRIYNLRSTLAAFSFDSDFGGVFNIDNIELHGNRGQGTAMRGVQIESTGGTPPNNIRSYNNVWDCGGGPWVITHTPGGVSGAFGDIWPNEVAVTGNRFVDGSNDTIHGANDSLVFRNLTIRGPGLNRKVIDYTSLTNYKDSRVIIRENHLDDRVTSQNDGETILTMVISASLPDGTRSPIYTVTIPGVRRDDVIAWHDYFNFNPLIDGMFFEVRCSADDTVKVCFFNKTSVDLNGSTFSIALCPLGTRSPTSP